MKTLYEKFQAFINALRATYYAREDIELSNRWQFDVMRDIRHLGPLNETINPFLFANRIVWRFAMVACMVVLVLSGYMAYTGFSPDAEIGNLFLENPVEFTIFQALGGF